MAPLNQSTSLLWKIERMIEVGPELVTAPPLRAEFPTNEQSVIVNPWLFSVRTAPPSVEKLFSNAQAWRLDTPLVRMAPPQLLEMFEAKEQLVMVRLPPSTA